MSMETSPGVATLADIVREVEALFVAAGMAQPRVEARDLVAAVLHRPRFWPIVHADDIPDEAERELLRAAARRRAAGAPFAYAVGSGAFRHLTLRVDERVLIPRPETEQLVDLVLARLRPGAAIADVGTGSGAIALALAAEARPSRVVATDISGDALAVARENARLVAGSLSVQPEFRMGGALAPLGRDRFDIIVSNPPYIAPAEMSDLPRSVRDWEPVCALTCPDDGLALTGEIILGASRHLTSGGVLALEVDCRRAQRVAERIAATGQYTDVTVHRDLTGRDRFVVARFRGLQ